MKWNACGRFACRNGNIYFILFNWNKQQTGNEQWFTVVWIYCLFSHPHKALFWLNRPKITPRNKARERAKELLMWNKVPVQVQNEPISIANSVSFSIDIFFLFFFRYPVSPVYRLHRLFPIFHWFIECNVSVQKSKINGKYRNKYERI